jgi:hypothetical protein
MIFGKPSSLSSLVRTGSVFSALVIAAVLFAGSFTTVQQTAATTTSNAEQEMLDTQDAATENLSESDRDVNGIEFTPRWGAVSILPPNSKPTVLFANCLEDEFAVSSMYMFESPDVVAYQSFNVAFADDTMTWLTVVKNTGTDNAAASIGVVCADENTGGEDDVDIDINIKTKIQNTVNNFVQIQNNQIINLQNVVNIQQQITQNAYNIAVISGNNNTVNQVIDQSVNQIANANTTNPVDIQQTINQNAENIGVIPSGGTLDQDIDQNAANVQNGGGGGTTIGQSTDQNATNTADVTDGGGGGTTIGQSTDQNAANTADVTGEEDGNVIDQAVAQGAGQTATTTDGGGGSTIGQSTDQNANQSALVNGEEEEEE